MVLYTFYRIVCNDTDMKYCYVGSTKNFTRRKCEHKTRCKTHDFKIYQVIRENGGWSNWSMIKIEDTDYESKLDSHKRERELLEQFGNGMNTTIPSRNWEEECQKEYYKQYREDNKEQITEIKKQYYEQNKEHIAEQSKQKFTCECGSKYRHTSKSRHLKTQRHKNFLQAA